jgi:hypothetical protein
MNTDERIRSLLEYLKHDYCDDKLDTPLYREYLSLLKEVSKDQLTRSKLNMMIIELPEEY